MSSPPFISRRSETAHKNWSTSTLSATLLPLNLLEELTETKAGSEEGGIVVELNREAGFPCTN
jgi:hypothetical protein